MIQTPIHQKQTSKTDLMPRVLTKSVSEYTNSRLWDIQHHQMTVDEVKKTQRLLLAGFEA